MSQNSKIPSHNSKSKLKSHNSKVETQNQNSKLKCRNRDSIVFLIEIKAFATHNLHYFHCFLELKKVHDIHTWLSITLKLADNDCIQAHEELPLITCTQKRLRLMSMGATFRPSSRTVNVGIEQTGWGALKRYFEKTLITKSSNLIWFSLVGQQFECQQVC